MQDLIKETKIRNIARLAKMLVDLYGVEENFKDLAKKEGQHVLIYLKELEGYLNFTLSGDRKNFSCTMEPTENPSAIITMRMKKENILKELSNIIRSRTNVGGLLKVVKLFLTGKVRIKGSYWAAISLCKCMMIGKNKIYKNSDKVISDKI